LKNNTTFNYDLANRLWSMGTITYGNDAAGARTSKNDGTNSWTYGYDGESRMTRVTKNGSVIEENIYDGVGMRVKRVSNGKTIYYVYSGPNPILEYSANDGKYTYYIFAGDKSVAEEKDGKKIFYHRDHLGSTRALTDQDRKLVGLCKYDPWGNLESTNEYDEGVLNGNFELAGEGGQVMNWTAINDSLVAGDCVYDTTNGINSSAALKITRNTSTGVAYWARKNLFVSPDTDYVLSGYFLSGNAQATKAKVQIAYYDSNGGLIRVDSSAALGYSGIWKAFSLSSHAPVNAATMEIRLTTEDTAGACVRFDGIRLKVPGLEGKYDFTGKRADEGTGLTYFGARFYDPETGRFTTMDAIAGTLNEPITQNRFVYCLDNPLNHIDSDGNYTYSPQSNIGYETATKGEGFQKTWTYDSKSGNVTCTYSQKDSNDKSDKDNFSITINPDNINEKTAMLLPDMYKEYMNILKDVIDPYLSFEFLKGWLEKKAVSYGIKALTIFFAVKLGQEVITYSLRNIYIGPLAFRWVGKAARVVPKGLKIGASVFASIVVDMIFPEPCY
jgi:RHS repeat-associated protein